MNTCTNCNGTKVEPNADGLNCHVCSVRTRAGSSTTQNVAPVAADVTNAVADGVSDYFLFSAIGDIASAVGSGIGTVAECAGDVVGVAGECVGGIIGAVLD